MSLMDRTTLWSRCWRVVRRAERVWITTITVDILLIVIVRFFRNFQQSKEYFQDMMFL